MHALNQNGFTLLATETIKGCMPRKGFTQGLCMIGTAITKFFKLVAHRAKLTLFLLTQSPFQCILCIVEMTETEQFCSHHQKALTFDNLLLSLLPIIILNASHYPWIYEQSERADKCFCCISHSWMQLHRCTIFHFFGLYQREQ